MRKYFHSLAGRLTLWYAGVFSLCFLAVFGAFYFIMQDHFHRWTDAELREEVVEVNLAYNQKGSAGAVQQLRMEEATEGGRFLGRIITVDGRIAFQTTSGNWSKVRVDQDLTAKARTGRDTVEMLEIDDNHAARIIYSLLPDGTVVQIGLTLLDHEIWMRRFARDLAKVALLALILSVGAGGFMAGRALGPIRHMAHTASTISGRSLGQRVPLSGRGDEVDQLALAFNGMLERIDTLVEGIRSVTDTLAHDLRTPITGIRGMAEVTLRSVRDPSSYRISLYRIMEQMDRLLALFNTILDVAEAETGALVLRYETVPFEELVDEIVRTFEPVARDKAIRLESTVAERLTLQGDRGRLSQALANLLDNAIKYTAPGGHVGLYVEPDPTSKGIAVTVTDTGVGIDPKDLPHIFERYYRGDKSRSGPGIGLGLPLVQGIVKTHGGSITVESRPGAGSNFRLFLPYGPCVSQLSCLLTNQTINGGKITH